MMSVWECPYCKESATGWFDISGSPFFQIGPSECCNCKKSLRVNIGTFILYYMGVAFIAFLSAGLYLTFILNACKYIETLIVDENTKICEFLLVPFVAAAIYLYLRILKVHLQVRMYLPKDN